MIEKESWNRKKSNAAFGIIFRNCKCSQRRKQNITFIMTRQSKWFETICTCTEITDLVLKDFKKYASHDPVPILDRLCEVTGSRDIYSACTVYTLLSTRG
jgi:hypothetical protein